MAQFILTNPEEIIEKLSQDPKSLKRELLECLINAILRAESDNQLQAGRYSRTEDRTDYRNGFREREWITCSGKLKLQVPRHRNLPFKTLLFENYKRSEAALITTMAEMVVNGVATRKVERITEKLCGVRFSKSAVSEVCKGLLDIVNDFKQRPLEECYPFMTVDGTYFKVRENHRVISKAMMIAYATNDQGIRNIIGLEVYDKESKDTWTNFLQSLKKRGLKGVMVITSDAHEGIQYAISRIFPEVSWQRCQFHFSRNISDKAPQKYQTGIRIELNEMFNCRTIEEARKVRDRIIDDYKDKAPEAMECLDEGFEDSMTIMVLPYHLRKYYRTSNQVERINREMKRRSKSIGVFSNTDSLLRMMGSLLIELNDNLQLKKIIFKPENYESLLRSDIPEKLRAIAEEQKLMRAA